MAPRAQGAGPALCIRVVVGHSGCSLAVEDSLGAVNYIRRSNELKGRQRVRRLPYNGLTTFTSAS